MVSHITTVRSVVGQRLDTVSTLSFSFSRFQSSYGAKREDFQRLRWGLGAKAKLSVRLSSWQGN